MQLRRLIIGSGVTAGLAANLLADEGYETDWMWSKEVTSSPIPELLPRRIFFESLGVEPEEETFVIAEVAPAALKEVIWINDDGERMTGPLASNEEFLVYDKGRLAKWLRQRAIAGGAISNELGYDGQTLSFEGYQSVLDCRGYNVVSEDPKYMVSREVLARTACTYAIASRPEQVEAHRMMFWSAVRTDGTPQTFFFVPIDDDKMSVGCSHPVTMPMDVSAVLSAMRDFGIPVTSENIFFSGQTTPHIYTASSLVEHVVPVGESARRSCPLTEYGVMVALSQLLQLAGKIGLSSRHLLRPVHNQIDPHIPLELFS